MPTLINEVHLFRISMTLPVITAEIGHVLVHFQETLVIGLFDYLLHGRPEIVNVNLLGFLDVVLLDHLRVVDFPSLVDWTECFDLRRILQLDGRWHDFIGFHRRNRVVKLLLVRCL